MLTGLWTVGIKVPDLARELRFQQQLGSTVVLDEAIEFGGESYRIPLVRVADKYVHLAERMVYERLLDKPLPYGIAHLVYMSNDIELDIDRAISAGAIAMMDLATVSAGFGTRKVAFLRSPSGYVFEVIEILENRVPPV